MLMFPKPTKRPKRKPKPLKRSRIKPGRSKFEAHGENPFKQYHSSYSTAEIDLWAEQKAEERRRHPTPEEAAIEEILMQHGIKYEREKIWPNGDHPVFSDFYLPRHFITLEIDGRQHAKDVTFDARRANWLARKHKVGTVRFTNKEVASGAAEARIIQMLGLG